MSEWTAALAEVRAISFDLDFTLWDLGGVIQRAEQRMREFLAQSYPRTVEHLDSEALAERRRMLLKQRPELRHNVTAWRKAGLAELAALAGYGETLVEEAFAVFLDARHEVTPYPDTVPLLEALRPHYRLGVITNGNADVHRIGLGGYFDFVVSAVDIGAAKPDHLIFEAAHHRAGVMPEQILHVGDEPESDVFGAASYGMRAAWIDRDGREWPEGLPLVPHMKLDSLQALGALLQDVLKERERG